VSERVVELTDAAVDLLLEAIREPDLDRRREILAPLFKALGLRGETPRE
jgi:hypothetical protein